MFDEKENQFFDTPHIVRRDVLCIKTNFVLYDRLDTREHLNKHIYNVAPLW